MLTDMRANQQLDVALVMMGGLLAYWLCVTEVGIPALIMSHIIWLSSATTGSSGSQTSGATAAFCTTAMFGDVTARGWCVDARHLNYSAHTEARSSGINSSEQNRS